MLHPLALPLSGAINRLPARSKAKDGGTSAGAFFDIQCPSMSDSLQRATRSLRRQNGDFQSERRLKRSRPNNVGGAIVDLNPSERACAERLRAYSLRGTLPPKRLQHVRGVPPLTSNLAPRGKVEPLARSIGAKKARRRGIKQKRGVYTPSCFYTPSSGFISPVA